MGLTVFEGLSDLGATKLSSGAGSTNKNLATKHGWSVKRPGKGMPLVVNYYSSESDSRLAKDIYCFQHKTEKCPGNCTPSVSTKDCYNRDGMIGLRTLQELANAIIKKTPDGTFFDSLLSLPQKYYVGGVKSPPAASDLASDKKKEEDVVIDDQNVEPPVVVEESGSKLRTALSVGSFLVGSVFAVYQFVRGRK